VRLLERPILLNKEPREKEPTIKNGGDGKLALSTTAHLYEKEIR
jgi:hypothetical protein